MEIYSDEYFMKMAFKEAEYALQREEIPVGAVIVAKNQIIARGHNLTEQLNDFTAHAEMQAPFCVESRSASILCFRNNGKP